MEDIFFLLNVKFIVEFCGGILQNFSMNDVQINEFFLLTVDSVNNDF